MGDLNPLSSLLPASGVEFSFVFLMLFGTSTLKLKKSCQCLSMFISSNNARNKSGKVEA